MAISHHIETFAGLPVVDFDPARPATGDGPVAWRLSVDYHSPSEDFPQRVDALLAAVDPATVQALVVGMWGEPFDESFPAHPLVRLAPRLTGLRALFIGEMTYEECEISWIQQGDVTPLLSAFPGLEVLRVRGAEGLALSPVRHERLRELAFESGGFPGEVTRAVAACDLPALEHLELWLGTDSYGGDTTVDDLAPVLSGSRLPALRHLGLRNAETADQVAAAVATAPVVARLHTLDLSLGTLTDAGAEALLAGQPLTHLRRFDLHHHYLSEEMAERLVAELPGVEVDVSDARSAGPYGPYPAVTE